jgi:hypothetical protein
VPFISKIAPRNQHIYEAIVSAGRHHELDTFKGYLTSNSLLAQVFFFQILDFSFEMARPQAKSTFFPLDWRAVVSPVLKFGNSTDAEPIALLFVVRVVVLVCSVYVGVYGLRRSKGFPIRVREPCFLFLLLPINLVMMTDEFCRTGCLQYFALSLHYLMLAARTQVLHSTVADLFGKLEIFHSASLRICFKPSSHGGTISFCEQLAVENALYACDTDRARKLHM